MARVVSRRTFSLAINALAGTGTEGAPIPYKLGSLFLLDELRVVIPSGHCGIPKLRVVYEGQQIVPWSDTPPSYVVGDDMVLTFAFEDLEVGTDGLQVFALNTDIWNHTWQLYAIGHDIPKAVGGAAGPLII